MTALVRLALWKETVHRNYYPNPVSHPLSLQKNFLSQRLTKAKTSLTGKQSLPLQGLFFTYFSLQCIQFFCYLMQIFPDRNFLRTDFLTFSTSDTMICLRFSSIPDHFSSSVLYLVYCLIVPDSEISRNIYSRRTWHTVSTTGASVLHTRFQSIRCVLDQLLFLL